MSSNDTAVARASIVTEHAPTIRGLKRNNEASTTTPGMSCDGTRPDNQGIETCSGHPYPRRGYRHT